MKKYSNVELKEIKKNLLNGIKYTGIRNNLSDGLIYFDGKYIHYNYFGSSAIKNTIKDLKWLLETIFNNCDVITECVYSEYYVNYKPTNKSYKCNDLSMKHPNVYGM